MQNILSQIPKEVIERYQITETENFVNLYTYPKNLIGYISLPKNEGENIRVEETESCIYLRVIGKFHLSLYKEVQHTNLSLF